MVYAIMMYRTDTSKAGSETLLVNGSDRGNTLYNPVYESKTVAEKLAAELNAEEEKDELSVHRFRVIPLEIIRHSECINHNIGNNYDGSCSECGQKDL